MKRTTYHKAFRATVASDAAGARRSITKDVHRASISRERCYPALWPKVRLATVGSCVVSDSKKPEKKKVHCIRCMVNPTGAIHATVAAVTRAARPCHPCGYPSDRRRTPKHISTGTQ